MDNQIKEAIILAGGLGSRLRDTIGDIPKPLAQVNGQPFLHFLFKQLAQVGIEKVVLSVGYKWEMIEDFFGQNYLGIEIAYAVEDERLGTGGGIQLALQEIGSDNCFIINGDTYFEIDWQKLAAFHLSEKNICTIAAKSLQNFDRYGTIKIDESGVVLAFEEKKPKSDGIINGGIYCLNKSVLPQFPKKDSFSFEQEYLEPNANSAQIRALVFDDYFMDIGIAEDYKQFEADQYKPFSQLEVDDSWTLFLDRDGVINERLIDNYVKHINELRILDGVPEAIASFTELFGRIVVVTNQQGIGKGWMDENDLEIIHGYMNNVFINAGGKIDHFYFAPQLASEQSNFRKPGTGMGLQAKKDFPEIDFSKSLLIGDSESDIDFGMKLGMKTIMLTNVSNVSTKADYIFNNLRTVAEELKKQQ